MLLLLKSAEHNECPRIVELPAGMSFAEGEAITRKCRDDAQSVDEEGWTWEDIRSRLQEHGITEPEWDYGPIWDY